jgi:hypothetical protein
MEVDLEYASYAWTAVSNHTDYFSNTKQTKSQIITHAKSGWQITIMVYKNFQLKKPCLITKIPYQYHPPHCNLTGERFFPLNPMFHFNF